LSWLLCSFVSWSWFRAAAVYTQCTQHSHQHYSKHVLTRGTRERPESNFRSVTVDDVIRWLLKSSPAVPIPTSVLKQASDVIAPFIVELFNCSLSAGHFPAAVLIQYRRVTDTQPPTQPASQPAMLQ